MRLLLDTNAYSLYAGGQERVVNLVMVAEEVLISVVVLGELLLGFRRGSRLERNYSALQDFLATPKVSIVGVGTSTAEIYARLGAELRAKGRPIPSNDIWIAAHAMETGAELISADHHFEQVDGIEWMRVGQA